MWRRLLDSRRFHVVVFLLIVALFIAYSIEVETDSRRLGSASDSANLQGRPAPDTDRPGRSEDAASRFDSYAGPHSCKECHRSIHDSFVETHHYLTSSLPVHDRSFGSFHEGENVVKVANTPIYFKMDGRTHPRIRNHRIGIYE